jgi:peptidoglycan/xylan/chitin deacetylase (PgdA/CDA1 family)
MSLRRRSPARRPVPAAGLVLGCLTALALASPSRRDPPEPDPCRVFTCDQGGVVRGRLDRKELALVFTGGDYDDGLAFIRDVLRARRIPAGFFFTGDFYRAPAHGPLIRDLRENGHYLGPHSDRHLLYCDWEDRGRTLVGRAEFDRDLQANFEAMRALGLRPGEVRCFIPPYEWYNRDIVRWARELGLVLFNFTGGTTSNADYTVPSTENYLSSPAIFDNILRFERTDPHGLNGVILLLHVGTDPERTDKFYFRLDELVRELTGRGYAFVRIDRLLDLG